MLFVHCAPATGQLWRLAMECHDAGLVFANSRLLSQGRFAPAEPGLFHTAFSVPDNAIPNAPAARAGASGLNAFQLLGQALDQFVLAGLLPAERRAGAVYLAWSAVHGLAVLLTDSPLCSASSIKRNQIGQQLLDMVEKGL
jgi:hypothetical protein